MSEPPPRNVARTVFFAVIGALVMAILLGIAVIGASAFLWFLLR